jgi:hypothetical protein
MLKKKWACILWLSLLGGFPDGSRASCCAVAEDAGRQAVEIPFEMYNDNLVVVEGTIGTMENARILLDTGTGATIVGSEIAARLNLKENPQKVRLTTLDSSLDVRSVIVSEIKIGALHLTPARVTVKDLTFLQRRLGVSIVAIAGLDLLRTRSFMIDFPRRKIVFTPNKLPRKYVRFETQRPFLTVKAKVAGYEHRLLVDSATPGLLVFRNRLSAGSEKLAEIPNRNARMFTASGTMNAKWLRASDVLLGTESIGPQAVLVAESTYGEDFELDGLLGFVTTGFQRVWLDFENGLFGWS